MKSVLMLGVKLTITKLTMIIKNNTETKKQEIIQLLMSLIFSIAINEYSY